MRSSCFKGKGNRIVEQNHQLEDYKENSKRAAIIRDWN